MYTQFSNVANRTVCGANYMYYAQPTLHPDRILREHDFIYLLNGEWKIGQNDETFDLTEESLLILAADNPHFGITPCDANTKTISVSVDD